MRGVVQEQPSAPFSVPTPSVGMGGSYFTTEHVLYKLKKQFF